MSTATTHSERPALTTKGAVTRARIVDAAATLIREKSAAATSIDQVRAAAQVSASQLYHYFGDKRELVRAVVAHETDLALAEHHVELEDIRSLESLRAWRDAVVTSAEHRGFRGGSPLGSLASELAEADPDARPVLVDGFERWQAPLERGLTAMRESGALRPDTDPESLALSLLAAVQGGLLLSQLRRDARALKSALDAALAHIESLSTAPTPVSAPAPPRPSAPAQATVQTPALAVGASDETPDAPSTFAPAPSTTTTASGMPRARVPLKPRRLVARSAP